MAKFRVLEKSFIGIHLMDAGAEVDLDIEWSKDLHPNLEPLEPTKTKAKKVKAEVEPPEGDLV